MGVRTMFGAGRADRGMFIGIDIGRGTEDIRKRKQTEKLVRKGWHRDVAELLPPMPARFGFGIWSAKMEWYKVRDILAEINKLPEEQRWEIVAQLGGYDRE